jgi:outer membrane protein OmpA-like peptidoglycan-associated protein
MMHFARPFARGLAATLLVAGCSKITVIEPDAPLEIQAKPPAPPLPDLPAVKQPPPPPRVVVEGDLVQLDEALGFDEQGKLAADHQDILAELAKWLTANSDVLVLSIEVQAGGEGSRRAQQKRTKAMATQVVDALVQTGVDAERLAAVGSGKSEDGQTRVVLRITERAEAAVVVEEKAQ